jgi:hypothetical protein
MEIEGKPQSMSRIFNIFKTALDLAYRWQIEGQSAEPDEAFLEQKSQRAFDALEKDLSHYRDGKTYLNIKMKSGEKRYNLYMEIRPVADRDQR